MKPAFCSLSVSSYLSLKGVQFGSFYSLIGNNVEVSVVHVTTLAAMVSVGHSELPIASCQNHPSRNRFDPLAPIEQSLVKPEDIALFSCCLYMETTVSLSRPQFIGWAKRVATSMDSESQDPSSNLSRTFFSFPSLVFFLLCAILQELLYNRKSFFGPLQVQSHAYLRHSRRRMLHDRCLGQDYTELAHMTEVANQNTPLVACMVHYPMSE